MSEKQNCKRRILLCVAGLTPQIVTETLYALTQERKERIDEIRVITTIHGRDKIKQLLLDPQTGKFFEFCRDYDMDPATIKFDETTIALLRSPDGCTLTDIRMPEENEYAGDQICEIVRELAKDPNIRVHASAAGGRKTMSIYLTAAMQLFGRVQDTLTHVLVSEDFETHPDFFYIPPVPRILKKRDGQEISTEKAKIYLADIPFIRLQGVMWDRMHKADRGYNQLVRQTQDDLNLLESSHDLIVDLSRRKITVADRSIKLAEREFFIYSLFACLRKQQDGEEGFVAFDEISRRDLDALFRRVTRARGLERPLEDYELIPRFDFIAKLTDSISGKNCDPVLLSETFLQVIAKIKRKFESAGRLDRYLVVKHGDRGSSRYGLEVSPERIIFRD
jgi:CRISPR-associated protein (TIGR02584 family)